MATLVRADDMVTTPGKRYEKVRVTEITPATIAFTHATGAARIPLTEFGPDVQRKFGYDAAKAREWLLQAANTPSPTPRPDAEKPSARIQVEAIAHYLDDGGHIALDPHSRVLIDTDADIAHRNAVWKEIVRHGSPRPAVQRSSPETR